MKRLIKAVTLVFAAFVFMGSARDARACSCGVSPPPCEVFAKASAVFVGKVIDAAQQQVATREDGTKEVFDVGAIRFQVMEAFAGVKGREVTIHSGTGGGDCGYWFKRGEVYLVYAFGELSHLGTTICSRTNPIAEASEDMAFLHNLPASGTGGTLHGRVERFAGDLEHGPSTLVGPMVGLKVIVEGESRRFEVVTDKTGEYQKAGLPPGNYDVRLELPDHLGVIAQYDTVDRFGSYSGHDKLKVADRGCVRNDFSVWLDGRIGGRVTDAQGKPVKEAQIDLMVVGDADKAWSAWSDADGRYEFRRVQPGHYLLGINLSWVPKPESPYPRTYYPDTSEAAQAKVIAVGEGTRLNSYDIVLPAQFKERTLEGVVVWPDGRTAIGALVLYELADHPGKSLPQNVRTDANGRFSLKLFEGQKYLVYARTQTDQHEDMHAEALDIIPTASAEPVKFVLAKPGSGYEYTRILRHNKKH